MTHPAVDDITRKGDWPWSRHETQGILDGREGSDGGQVVRIEVVKVRPVRSAGREYRWALATLQYPNGSKDYQTVRIGDRGKPDSEGDQGWGDYGSARRAWYSKMAFWAEPRSGPGSESHAEKYGTATVYQEAMADYSSATKIPANVYEWRYTGKVDDTDPG